MSMERRIYGYRCRSCGTLHYPFRMRCRQCGNLEFFEFDPEPLPNTGTLLTFTHVHNLPAEYEVARLGLGVIELAGGTRVVGQLDIDQPRLGMAVEGEVAIVRREAYKEYWGYVFHAA
ncbi:MAG TPA: OB-fold domain-containing protein [Acidimicrobiia bacterium]